MGHWYYLMDYGFVPIIWKKLAIMTSFRKDIKKMELKVGDMVKYQGQTVRIIQSDSQIGTGDREIKLAGFGWFKSDNSDIELVESVKQPQLQDGDYVIVQDIPRLEKKYYGTTWMPEMNKYVGKTVQISNPRQSNYSGEVASIGGWTFQTYHLEPVLDYDII